MAKETKKIETVLMPVSSLKEHPNNPRSITQEALEILAESLKEDRQLFSARPVIVSNRTGENIILAGNQRYKASIIAGFDKIPVYLIPGLTEKEEERIMFKDNADNYGKTDWAIMENSGWIDDLINNPTLGIKVPEMYLPKVESDVEAKPRAVALQDFTIYFADDDEYAEFMKFLSHLRNRFGAFPSVSKRILAWVAELYTENNQLEDAELLMRLIKVSNEQEATTENETPNNYDEFAGCL